MRTVVVALAVVVLAGCGGVKSAAEKSKAENALKALSIDYLEFQNANQGRPPAGADELTAFVKGSPDPALRPGELEKLTVQWGAKLDPEARPEGAGRGQASPRVRAESGWARACDDGGWECEVGERGGVRLDAQSGARETTVRAEGLQCDASRYSWEC